MLWIIYLGDGYKEDRKRFKDFFADILRYNVFCDGDKYENVTRQQLLDTMTEIKNEIASKAKLHQKPYYDRFVFIILTHGTQVFIDCHFVLYRLYCL